MNWRDVSDTVTELAKRVTQNPDIIVAVVRGGLIPARLLAKPLNVSTMYALTIRKNGPERIVTNTIDDDLSGKHVLLVEDVLESGKSMVVAKKYLEDLGAVVQTASLYFLSESELTPDYSIGELENVPVFPWD